MSKHETAMTRLASVQAIDRLYRDSVIDWAAPDDDIAAVMIERDRTKARRVAGAILDHLIRQVAAAGKVVI